MPLPSVLAKLRNLSRRTLIILAVLVVGVPTAYLIARPNTAEGTPLVAPVKQGEFTVTVTVAGELRAASAVEIRGPAEMQRANANGIRITQMVPEGTIVKKGDWVAELDRAPMAQRMTDVALALQKAEAQYEQAAIDTAMTLATARENIRTLEASVEEQQLAKEQAVYEAPTVKRQAEINYDKAVRSLAQARVDYAMKIEQAKARLSELSVEVTRQRNLLATVERVMEGFTIRSPGDGMVIYLRNWDGRKRGIGSTVGGWEPQVATIPDLNQMESLTYVNEIDVRKILVGQSVALSLDADPTTTFAGTVKSVANVGEQRPNSDAKVFEVVVAVTRPDTALRPGMTTSNAIRTATIPNALAVPLEAISAEDGRSYVYKRGVRVTKQEVELGAMNDNEVVIVRGLEAGDAVLLVPPPNADRLTPERLP